MESLYVALGFVLGAVWVGVGTRVLLGNGGFGYIREMAPALLAALAVLVLFGQHGVTLAQTATPVPATTITIPTDTLFEATNDWIETFAPIAAIGIGITVALAVLGYLGKMIASAFKA